MLDVMICANFGVEKLRGLWNTRGQILEFPIEMAGHLYNMAGATAQPVIVVIVVTTTVSYNAKLTYPFEQVQGCITMHVFAWIKSTS